jgi:hypothetical protein
MNSKMLLHPVILRRERTRIECNLAADHINEEARRSLEVRYRYANVFRTRQSRQSHFSLLGSTFGSRRHWQ